MAKTLKFDDEVLTDAVLKYAELYPGKISASSLAKWADTNILELRGVKYYHFTRPIIRQTEKGGIITEQRECTKKLNEINQMRSGCTSSQMNILLNSSKIDDVMLLSSADFRNQILEARLLYEEIKKKNLKLEAENRILKKEAEKSKISIEQYKNLEKRLNDLSAIISKRNKAIAKSMAKEEMAKAGIYDDGIDLESCVAALNKDIQQVFSLKGITKPEHKHKTLADSMIASVESIFD